jgi:hypothetical protein
MKRRREMENLSLEICKKCKEDPKVFCPRNVDVQCLDCGLRVCGGHIIEHLKEHCIATDLKHCREE